MNILPHKSWHVRTKKNIARVRRDEEKAAKEEEERLRRVNLAEHEARIQVLKAKRGLPDDEAKRTRKDSTEGKDQQEKFSLFDNYQDTGGRDTEKEAEKKAEQEKWEVKTGIFSYIDGRYKHENEDQWYLKVPRDREKQEEVKDKVLDLKEDRAKQRLDPLLEIKRNLAQMEKNSNESSASTSTTLPNQTTMRIDVKPEIKTELVDYHQGSRKNRSHHSEEKKHKKKKKEKSSKHAKSHRKSKKRRHHSSDSDSEDDDKRAEKEALAQRLRLERLERERKERLRTQLLLQGPSQPKADAATLANQQRYNSQFNPHIARQNQPQQ